jgi:NDP-sugar pyrophosphorylase family protein
MQVVILAGGLGTRIRPLSGDRPKALIPIHGIPFIEYQLFWLAQQGIRQVVLLIGYRADMIRSVVGDGRQFGLCVTYADEGEQLRGTAGALRYAADLDILDAGFLVLYGDSYLPTDIMPVWAAYENGRRPIMTVLQNRGRWDKSNVRYHSGRPIFYDKHCPDPAAAGMDYIDYGLIVLPRNLITSAVPTGGAADLADVLGAASRHGLIDGFEVSERFYEIGSPQGVRDFEAFIAEHPQLVSVLKRGDG